MPEITKEQYNYLKHYLPEELSHSSWHAELVQALANVPGVTLQIPQDDKFTLTDIEDAQAHIRVLLDRITDLQTQLEMNEQAYKARIAELLD